MEVVPRFSHRLLLPLSPANKFFPKSTTPLKTHHSHKIPLCHYRHFRKPSSNCQALTRQPDPVIRPVPFLGFVGPRSSTYAPSSRDLSARARWLTGMREKPKLPEIVKAGDPVLHEPARKVSPDEIGSDQIQKLIDDMVRVMRVAPGVGLAAPQIGVPLQIIVLEDTQEYINFQPKEETEAQQRRPFDLVAMINPKLKPKTNKTALFFEGCLSVDGYRAIVERFLEVEVTGLDRYGQPVKVNASGWQARIFQHECDHLAGTIYVDKMVKRTFRTTENLNLPLPMGCPKLGPC